MKVFLPVSTTQELKVRTRRKIYNVTLSIRDESKDTTIEQTLTGSFSSGFFVLPFAYDFEEDMGYEISVFDAIGILWRGKAYCTTQNPQEYKLNNGVITA